MVIEKPSNAETLLKEFYDYLGAAEENLTAVYGVTIEEFEWEFDTGHNR